VRRELIPIAEPRDLWMLLARWGLPQTGASLWCKQAIRDVGGWKHDQPCCQEHELYLRLLVAGKRFSYSPTTGAVYRNWNEETVSRRDITEVHRQRLAIEQAAEDHLRAIGELTPARLRTISLARFEIARIAWHYDASLAQRIMRSVFKADPQFWPEGQAAPTSYRIAFRWLGFHQTERLASFLR
jgi:hypothetical protein